MLAIANLRQPMTTAVADLTLILRPPPLIHPSTLFPTPSSPSIPITALAASILPRCQQRLTTGHSFSVRRPPPGRPNPTPPPPPFPSTFIANTFTPSQHISCSAIVSGNPPAPSPVSCHWPDTPLHHHPTLPACTATLTLAPLQTDHMRPPPATCRHCRGRSLLQPDAFLMSYPPCPSPGLGSLGLNGSSHSDGSCGSLSPSPPMLGIQC